MNLEFDLNELSVGELVDLTDVAGDDALTDLGSAKVTPKALLALVWIMGRRTNPELTLDDARAIKVVDVQFASTPATNGAPAPAPNRAARRAKTPPAAVSP